MEDLEIYTMGSMMSSSSAMFDRRRRILDEARRMILHDGMEGFSVRKLSKRADVAAGTLYNAFGSKESIIAIAIRSYFETFEGNVHYDSDPASFEGALDRQITTILRNLEIPNYVKAVAAIYFSPSITSDIREVLLAIGGAGWKLWLQEMAMRHHLHKPIDLNGLLIDLSNLAFAKVHEWGAGALSDEQYLDRTIEGLLVHLVGALKGSSRKQALETLIKWRSDIFMRNGIVANARERLGGLARVRSP